MKSIIKFFLLIILCIGTTSSVTSQNILYAEPFSSCEWPEGWTQDIIAGNKSYEVEETTSADPDYGDECILYLLDDGGRNDPMKVNAYSPYIQPLNGDEVFIDFKINFIKNNLHPQILEIYYEQGGQEYLFERIDSSLWGATFNEYVDRTIVIDNQSRAPIRFVVKFDNGGRSGAIISIDNIIFRGEDNRLCENATSIELNQTECILGNNAGLDNGLTFASCEGIMTQRAIWYQFVAPEAGYAKVSTDATFNDVIDVYYGFCSGLTPFRCSNDDEYGFIGDDLYFRTTKDVIYYIRITGYRNLFGVELGDFCLSVDAVPGIPSPGAYDVCSGALDVELNKPCLAANNVDATTNGPAPSLNEKSRSDIWFRYVHDTDEPVDIRTNANFSDVITVFSGSCLFLSEVAGTDHGPNFDRVQLVRGQSYYIQVSGYFSTLEGQLCLEVMESEEREVDNETCENPLLLEVNSGSCLASQTVTATWSGQRSSCQVKPGKDVWYSFNSENITSFALDVEADFEYTMALFHGDCDSLIELRCISDFHGCDGYLRFENLERNTIYYLQLSSKVTAVGISTGDVCVSLFSEGDEPAKDPLNVITELTCIGGPWGILEVNTTGGEGAVIVNGSRSGDLIKFSEPYFITADDENGCRAIGEGFGTCNEEVDCDQNDLKLEVVLECEMDRFNLPTGRVQVIIQASGGVGNITSYGIASGDYVDNGENIQVVIMDEGGCMRSFEEVNTCMPYDCGQSDLELALDIICIDTLWKAQLNISALNGNGNYTFSGDPNGALLDNDATYSVIVEDETGCADSITGIIDCEFDSCVFSGLELIADYTCIRDANGNITGEAVLTINTKGGIGQVQVSGGANGDTVRNGDQLFIELSDDWNCSLIKEINIECSPTSTSDVENAGIISLYPNPSQDWTMLQYYSASAGMVQVELLQASGVQALMFNEQVQSGVNTLPIIYGDLPSGLYYVRISQDGQTSEKRLIVK